MNCSLIIVWGLLLLHYTGAALRVDAVISPKYYPTKLHTPCGTMAHSSWITYNDTFFNHMKEQLCRLPECLQTCHQNQGFLSYPRTPIELSLHSEYFSSSGEPILLGIYLPTEMPSTTLCEKEACNKVLRLADGQPFQYRKWMGSIFDRTTAQQERCYAIKTKFDSPEEELTRLGYTRVVSSPCISAHRMMCQARCPRLPPRSTHLFWKTQSPYNSNSTS